MFKAQVTDIEQNNDQVFVSFTVANDAGETVAELRHAFPADISKKELKDELDRVARQHSSDAKQAVIQAVNEAKTENVDNLRKHFLGESDD